MYYVYFLKSVLKDEMYIGSTKNLRKRISEHVDGQILVGFDKEGLSRLLNIK